MNKNIEGSKMEKVLTIAIPTYNRAHFLKRALESISEQYDDRIEIIVSDNASQDETENIVNQIKSNMPIRYIKNVTNIGADMNFLQCFRMATGKYTVLLGDDDIVISGALKIVLDYLAANGKQTLIFLNHTYFEGEYNGDLYTQKLYGEIIENKSKISKTEFFDYVKGEIIYMSSVVLSTKKANEVENPERFSWTYFMHSCLAFEATKDDSNNLGIVGTPCIAKDATDNEHSIDRNPEVFFAAYFRGKKYLFFELAPSCGYDRDQMKKIYTSVAFKFGRYLIKLKAEDCYKWKESFWKYAYPAIKEFPMTWVKIIPIAVMPRFIAIFLYRYIRPLYKKIKGK